MIKTDDMPFSKKRYDKYDPLGKQVAIEWLTKLGFQDIHENEKESKRDFTEIWDIGGTSPTGKIWRIEAEVKKDWGTEWSEMPFRWDTMHFPYRKRDKAKVHATHMMVVGGDLKRLFIVNREIMLESPVEYKWVRNRRREEPFFSVPTTIKKSSF